MGPLRFYNSIRPLYSCFKNEGEDEDFVFNGYGTKFHFGMTKAFWRWMVVMATQRCLCMYATEHLKIVKMATHINIYHDLKQFFNCMVAMPIK